MNIRSIELKNFRNYENLEISFDEGTNILFGDNAQGKTNILEAAYMSGTTKSHKGSRDKEMIRFGEEEAHLKTVVARGGREYQIDMHLKKNRAKGIVRHRWDRTGTICCSRSVTSISESTVHRDSREHRRCR